MSDIARLDNIRTSQTAKLQSIPKGHKSKYLGLFMLNNEKDRLGREKKVLEKRLERNKARLKEIDHEIAEIEQESTGNGKATARNVRGSASNAKIEGKDWKTMEIDY